MSGNITCFEMPSSDIAATQRFWSSLFGWTFYEGNFPGYSMIQGPETQKCLRPGSRAHRPRIRLVS